MTVSPGKFRQTLPLARIGTLFLLAVLALLTSVKVTAQEPSTTRLAEAVKLQDQGNYSDALKLYREILGRTDPVSETISTALQRGVACLTNLQLTEEIDKFIEVSIENNPANWRLLRAAATQYRTATHQGFIVSGKFSRGWARGEGARIVSSAARDRVRALQLFKEATVLAVASASGSELSEIYQGLADTLVDDEPWKLQAKTALDNLPDYDDTDPYGYSRQSSVGAPVANDGSPVYYHVPKSFEESENDGQRWRWCLNQVARIDPAQSDHVQRRLAHFLESQFGTNTLAAGTLAGGDLPAPTITKSGEPVASGPYALHTLTDTETIARLASGIHRFKLEDEFNFIRIYQGLAGRSGPLQVESIEQLALIYESRRQYPAAAAEWQRAIQLAGPGVLNARQQKLDQIVGAWGEFEQTKGQPSEKRASFEFRFRNATSVQFDAYEIAVDKLLKDVTEYLQSRPKQLDWGTINVSDIGQRFIQARESEYRGQRVESWTTSLTPQPNHFDARTTIHSPLSKGGAYLITAKVAGGNESRIVLWLHDTIIVRKPVASGALYFVSDATSGAPIPGATLTFFGYQQKFKEGSPSEPPRSIVTTHQVTGTTDKSGIYLTTAEALDPNVQWLATARAADSRFAYLGFSGVWYQEARDPPYDKQKLYGVTDRPVYRPEQEIHYKVWCLRARYDQAASEARPEKKLTFQIMNPRDESIEEKTVELDTWGSYEGKLTLGKDAPLGSYYIVSSKHGSAVSFRLEEYKKPEFSVTIDAPTEPVALGEKIFAVIKANYYFGSPVSKGRAHIKVTRTPHETSWYPRGEWDWLYGAGYWWFAPSYEWLSGWSEWGVAVPHGSMRFFRPSRPPEIVQERDVELAEDGTIRLEIDTALAKALHGDTDHRYEIAADVVDASRRLITGTGSILVSRAPYKVYGWTDRGFYRVGDSINASFSARTISNAPVSGSGVLELRTIVYDDDRSPVESPVQSWPVTTSVDGAIEQKMIASKPGQYRLTLTLTDSSGHKAEGAYAFTVMGDKGISSTSDYRFNALELIPEKREYLTGETARLQINSDQKNAHVLLFLRPLNGIYGRPTLLQLNGKSHVAEIPVGVGDMPNFFVEVVSVSAGGVHSEMREIAVPPTKKALNIEISPTSKTFKPGQKVTTVIKVTDSKGAPVSSSITLSVYDKSVEYISDGSNIPDMKEHFWGWHRQHSSSLQSNASTYSDNLVPFGAIGMSYIGAFGELLQENLSSRGVVRAAPAAMRAKGVSLLGGNEISVPQESEPASPVRRQGSGPSSPTVRSTFADTAYWNGSIVTANDGKASVTFTLPEDLTTWKIRGWALASDVRVGDASTEIVTTKQLLIRPQAPRFLVERDEVVLSGVVHSYLPTTVKVTTKLSLSDDTLTLLEAADQVVEIPPSGEARVSWRARANREGTATIQMAALTESESDAVETKIPVYIHGSPKTDSFSGNIKASKETASVKFTVPTARKIEQSKIEVRFSPSLALAMVDALPYLVNFPYGCTEQTMNRFLPTVTTLRLLQSMNLDMRKIREKRINLNAQEIGDPLVRAAQWKKYDINPVFDEKKVLEMSKAGVDRLAAMQLADGGWGWFSGASENSSAHITAQIIQGLIKARVAKIPVPETVIERGLSYLTNYEATQLQAVRNITTLTVPYKTKPDNLDALVRSVLDAQQMKNAAMTNLLFEYRLTLSVYGSTLLGLALHDSGENEKLSTIIDYLRQFVVEDDENQTAYLRLENQENWWMWYGSEYEAHAYYLKLLARTEPASTTAPRLVKYLLNNRKHGTYWDSTRDTGLVIDAFADYLAATGETHPDMTVEVLLDGKVLKQTKITGENIFTAGNTVTLLGAEVRSGSHELVLRKKGTGALYFNAYVTNFSTEDDIKSAGLEVKVTRKYFKITSDKNATALVPGSLGQALNEQVDRKSRTPINSLDSVTSGDIVEVALTIESKNDYEYLIFEDKKPAGFEAVDVQSGYNGNELNAYVEFRDERVAFFVRELPRGSRSLTYRLRVQTPGTFSALPALVSGMYAPELRGNSDEMKVRVVE